MTSILDWQASTICCCCWEFVLEADLFALVRCVLLDLRSVLYSEFRSQTAGSLKFDSGWFVWAILAHSIRVVMVIMHRTECNHVTVFRVTCLLNGRSLSCCILADLANCIRLYLAIDELRSRIRCFYFTLTRRDLNGNWAIWSARFLSARTNLNSKWITIESMNQTVSADDGLFGQRKNVIPLPALVMNILNVRF